MRLKPLHDWVLIRRSEPEGRTAGGVIIPRVAEEKQTRGVVEAVGPGRVMKGKKGEKFVSTVLRPGQQVFFGEFAARDINLDGEEITLVREESILGVFEGGGDSTAKMSLPAGTKEKPLLEGKGVTKVVKGTRKKKLDREKGYGAKKKSGSKAGSRKTAAVAKSTTKKRTPGKTAVVVKPTRKKKSALSAGKTKASRKTTRSSKTPKPRSGRKTSPRKIGKKKPR